MLLHKLSSQPAHNLSTCCAYDIHEVRTTKPHDAYYRARLRAFVRNVKYVCALGYKQVYIALNMQLQPIFARQAYMQCLQPSQGCARVSRNITIVKHSIIRRLFCAFCTVLCNKSVFWCINYVIYCIRHRLCLKEVALWHVRLIVQLSLDEKLFA